MGMIKDFLDGLNYEEFGDCGARSYADSHVVAVHCYHNLVIIEKGRNADGGNRPKDWAVPRQPTSSTRSLAPRPMAAVRVCEGPTGESGPTR